MKRHKQLLIGLFVLLNLVLVGCSSYVSVPSTPPGSVVHDETDDEVPLGGSIDSSNTDEFIDDSGATNGDVREFNVRAFQWGFDPNPITVNEGDSVKLMIISEDVKHGFRLPEFNVREDLNPGETTVVEFVADKKGTFTFSCDVFCGSGHGSMAGQLIVE